MRYAPALLSSLPGRILSFVGGGGKTTLLYALAEYHAELGKRVLAATTTKIYQPRDTVFASSPEAAWDLWAQNRFAVIGTPEGEKLCFPPRDLWNALEPQADLILLEADGSRHHPIKIPRTGEPVILPACDAVVAVMGLSAIGRPLAECCFGLDPERYAPSRLLTEALAAQILSAEWGSRKNAGTRSYSVVLNQCDTPQRRESAERIAAVLKQSGISQVAFTSFSPEERSHYQKMSRRNVDL